MSALVEPKTFRFLSRRRCGPRRPSGPRPRPDAWRRRPVVGGLPADPPANPSGRINPARVDAPPAGHPVTGSVGSHPSEPLDVSWINSPGRERPRLWMRWAGEGRRAVRPRLRSDTGAPTCGRSPHSSSTTRFVKRRRWFRLRAALPLNFIRVFSLLLDCSTTQPSGKPG